MRRRSASLTDRASRSSAYMKLTMGDLPATWRQRLPQLVTYIGSSTSLLIGSVAQLVAFAILARALGVEQFGFFLAITAVTNISVQICGLGAMEPLVRRVARDPSAYPAFIGHNIILALVSGTVVFIGLLFVLPLFLPEDGVGLGGPDDVIYLAAMFGFTNTFLVRGILLTEQIFLAHSQFVKANIAAISFGVARALTAAVACFAFGVSTLAEWAAWHAAGHLILLIACMVAVLPLGIPKLVVQWDEVKRGLFFSWALVGQGLRQNIDMLVLGLVAPAAMVGSFGVARRIADTSYLAVNGLNRITYPRLAVAMEHSITDGLAISKKVLAAAVGISFLTAVGVYFVAPYLPLLFGPTYADMVPFLQAMCWVVIPFSVMAVASEILSASGHSGIRAILFNLTLVGSAFIGLMTYAFLATGTIVALYIVEILLACGFWATIWYLMQRERARSASADAEGGVDGGKAVVSKT
ncbi:MAG: lipopolysaccharide biosynthesis protein [Pseudomonadota bacterium]